MGSWVASGLMWLACVGCSVGPGREQDAFRSSPDLLQFAPLVVPADFDRTRAMLSLSQIPDDPPVPSAAAAPVSTPLPQGAARHFDEAIRLFAEQRYTEAILRVEKVLAYVPDDPASHRLMAIACVLSGRDERARLSAERVLSMWPNDPVCHYVLGRLAEKADDDEEALRRYRLSLKSPLSESDAAYRVLVHYHLARLLDEHRFYAAAVEQFQAFGTGLEAIGERAGQHPELDTINRLQKGAVAVEMAQAQGFLGDYAGASEALKVAVSQSPGDFGLRGEYVRMLARAGKLAEALSEARRFVIDSGGHPEAVRLLLAAHRFAGRPESGAAVMRELLDKQPDNVELWTFYAEALLDAEQREQAVEVLRDLLVRHPTAVMARWKLIEWYRSVGDWTDWLETLANALVIQPGDYVRVGEEIDRVPESVADQVLRAASGDGESGVRTVFPDVSDATQAAAMNYLLGRLHMHLGKDNPARRFFEQAVREEATFLPGTIGLADLVMRRFQWNDAIDVVRSGMRLLDKPSHLMERLLGECYDGLDKVAQAVEHYRKAIELNPSDSHSMMLLAGLYERLGRRDDARKQYQAVIVADAEHLLAREAYIRLLLDASEQLSTAPGRVSLEFAEMQRRGPRRPPTLRVGALLQFLHDRDQKAYCRTLRRLIQEWPDDMACRENLASTLVAFRDYEAARLELEEMLARDPRCVAGNQLMALVMTRLLDFDSAANQLETMLRMHPNREIWLRSLAEVRMTQQEYDAAVELWQRLLALRADSARPGVYRSQLIAAYRRAGRFEEGRRDVGQWLAEPGSNNLIRDSYRWFLLSLDHAEGSDEQYLARCRQWLADDPANKDIRGWLLGVNSSAPYGVLGQFSGPGGLVGAGRFNEAVAQIMEWIAKTPDDDELSSWLAEVLIESGQYDGAIELAQSLVDTETRQDAGLVRLYALEMVYTRAGRFQDAIRTAQDWIAQALKVMARLEPARRADFEAVILERRRAIGTLLSQAGEYDRSVAHFEGALEQSESESDKAAVLRMLALVHQRHGRPDLALDALRQAYDLIPTDIGINNDLGYTLADLGKDLDEAERMIRLAAGEAPHQMAYLDSLGWVLYKQGRFSEAIVWLNRAAGSEQGEDAVVFDHLGDTYFRLEQHDEALVKWRRALQVYESQVASSRVGVDEELKQRLVAKIGAKEGERLSLVAPLGTEAASGR